MRTEESPALRRMLRVMEPPPARVAQAWRASPEREEPEADAWPGVDEAWSHDAGDPSAGSPGPRLAMDRRAALAVGLVVLAGLVLCAWLVLRPGPAAQPLPPRAGRATGAAAGLSTVPGATPAVGVAGGGPVVPAVAGTAAAVPAAAVTQGDAISVYVVGAVHHPGVIQLATGTRVVDAVEAAGGATSRADLTGINLAQKLTDGEQILVPRQGQAQGAAVVSGGPGGSAGSPAATGSAGGASSTGAGPVPPLNLNSATEAQFDELPGIGPVMAGRIIAWRQQNGQFSRVDQLGEIQGIGDVTLQKLRPLVTV